MPARGNGRRACPCAAPDPACPAPPGRQAGASPAPFRARPLSPRPRTSLCHPGLDPGSSRGFPDRCHRWRAGATAGPGATAVLDPGSGAGVTNRGRGRRIRGAGDLLAACHGMSCFVMVGGGTAVSGRVEGAGPPEPVGAVLPALPDAVPWRQQASRREDREAVGSGKVMGLLLHSVSVRRPCRPGIGATLFRAYPARACAGGGARIAAARLVRLIARARRRTHFACRLNRGRSAPGRRGREAAPDASSPGPIISLFLRMQAPKGEILPAYDEHIAVPAATAPSQPPGPLPGRTAAGPLPASPASGRGEERSKQRREVKDWGGSTKKAGRPEAARPSFPVRGWPRSGCPGRSRRSCLRCSWCRPRCR